MEREGTNGSTANVDSISNLSGEDIFDDIMNVAEELKGSLSLLDKENAFDNDLTNDTDIKKEVKSNNREDFQESSISSHTDSAEDSGLESMHEMREELQNDPPSPKDIDGDEKCMSRVSSNSSCSDSASNGTLDSWYVFFIQFTWIPKRKFKLTKIKESFLPVMLLCPPCNCLVMPVKQWRNGRRGPYGRPYGDVVGKFVSSPFLPQKCKFDRIYFFMFVYGK